MATTFTVGGVDLGAHSPQTWTDDGQRIRIAGTIRESTQAKALVAAARLKGLLNNPDEDAVVVTPSSDSSLSGFYRVVGGAIDPGPALYRSYWAPYTLELERVPSYSTPQLESRILGAVRANSHSIVIGGTAPWWAVPSGAQMAHVTGSSTAGTRAGESATMTVYYTTSGTVLVDTTRRWTIPATNYYDGAARLEITGDSGTTWVNLPGRTGGQFTAASTTGWRLNNGLMRVIYGGGDGLLSVQWYKGSAWSTAKIFKLTTTSTPTTLGAVNTISILRNCPEEVLVRLGLSLSSSAPSQINVDLGLRRGSRYVTLYVSTAESATTTFGLYRNSAEAATALTGGVRATSNDADSIRYVLGVTGSKTNDLTQGGFYAAAANAVGFMIGADVSSGSAPNDYTTLLASYFAATREQVRFVQR